MVYQMYPLHWSVIKTTSVPIYSVSLNLVADDDGSVDGCAHEARRDDVEVCLGGGRGVADRHSSDGHGIGTSHYTTKQQPHVDQARVLLLDSLHGLAEALELLHLELELLLVDVHRLELAAVIRHPAVSTQVSGVLCAVCSKCGAQERFRRYNDIETRDKDKTQ